MTSLQFKFDWDGDDEALALKTLALCDRWNASATIQIDDITVLIFPEDTLVGTMAQLRQARRLSRPTFMQRIKRFFKR